MFPQDVANDVFSLLRDLVKLRYRAEVSKDELAQLDRRLDESVALLEFHEQHYPSMTSEAERGATNPNPTIDDLIEASSKPAQRSSHSHSPQKNNKRSSEQGEAREKLIATLSKYHKFADGGCLELEPISNNKLARLADVSKSTASTFFNNEFNGRNKGGHAKYRAKCQDARTLAYAIKAMRGEFKPAELEQMTTDAFNAGKRFADEE